jgi:mRNA interferase MazF
MRATWLDFGPQAGREQAGRRTALVITDQAYNRANGLAVLCPLASKRLMASPPKK